MSERWDYYGPCVNLGARIGDTGHGGQIIVSQELVDACNPDVDGAFFKMQDLGLYCLKGVAEPTHLHQGSVALA